MISFIIHVVIHACFYVRSLSICQGHMTFSAHSVCNNRSPVCTVRKSIECMACCLTEIHQEMQGQPVLSKTYDCFDPGNVYFVFLFFF